jgi:hypothetical protein
MHLWIPARNDLNAMPLLGTKSEIELYLNHPHAYPGARVALGPQAMFEEQSDEIGYRFVRGGEMVSITVNVEKDDLVSAPKLTKLSISKNASVDVHSQNGLEGRLNGLTNIKQELATRLVQVV